jgi:hypothetical protein
VRIAQAGVGARTCIPLVTAREVVRGIVVLLRGSGMRGVRGVETAERSREETDGDEEPAWVRRVAMGGGDARRSYGERHCLLLGAGVAA